MGVLISVFKEAGKFSEFQKRETVTWNSDFSAKWGPRPRNVAGALAFRSKRVAEKCVFKEAGNFVFKEAGNFLGPENGA